MISSALGLDLEGSGEKVVVVHLKFCAAVFYNFLANMVDAGGDFFL